MENSGDKFASLIIPNCHRTNSQEEKLQSCPFARESKATSHSIPSSSSSDEATGIEMLTLPDSFDEYQTPPEQPSYSHNSRNDADGHITETKTTAFVPVDDAGEPQEQRIVDLANESDNLDTEPMDLDDGDNEIGVSEAIDTEVISSPEENENAHKVFVEMPQREPETSNRGKRKLPFVMKAQKQNSNYEGFKDALNRVLKMVGEGGRRCGGEGDDDEVDVNFVETAKKKRGLCLPRPRWWPVQGFKD